MKLDTVDLKKLNTFCLVAEIGSLQAAADQLDLTVPAISTQVRRLEEELGVTLFERLPNRLILTEIGKQFLPEANAVLERMRQAVATLAPETVRSGRLTVSIVGDHLSYFAPKIARFMKQYRDVDLSLRVYQTNYALGALQAGELDLCLGIYSKIPERLERHVLTETSLSLLCPRDHPLTKISDPSLKDISRHRIVTLPSYAESRTYIDSGFARNGLRLRQVLEVAGCQTARTFVEMGLGAAIVHSLCIGHSADEGLRTLDLGRHLGRIPFNLVCRRGALKSPLLEEFRKSLV